MVRVVVRLAVAAAATVAAVAAVAVAAAVLIVSLSREPVEPKSTASAEPLQTAIDGSCLVSRSYRT